MSNPKPLSKLEADLRRRLRRIDPRTDAGNGTLLADAAASLIAADAVQAGADPAAIARLTNDDLSAAQSIIGELLRGAKRQERRFAVRD